MMPPAVIYVRAGCVPIPVPVLLLWPLLALALVAGTLLLPLVPLRGTTAGRRALLPVALWRVLAAMRGLRIDLTDSEGKHVLIICW